MLDYKIISSGSKGNCVVIENVMVDCGLPYKTVKDELFNIDYLLITHKHRDHVIKRTYEKIREEFPNITVITNQEVAELLDDDVDYVISLNEPLDLDEYEFTAFKCVHDVMTYGYYWTFYVQHMTGINPDDDPNQGDWIEEIDIIYATDTHDFRYAPKDKKFDYLFLESNHDENKLNAIKYNARKKYGYDAYGNGLRHASTQVAKGYYYMHRKSEESEFIELHKSERFH